MDNLFAIGVGLGLRALIDVVTKHNHRVNGSLVGLWEGAVLRHFISKYPSSLDPYVAYGFRLLVDLLWTSSYVRLLIVVLWTFMGILLSDVGLDLYADRRIRRLMRSVRHTVIYPLLHQLSRSTTLSAAIPSRVQFFQTSRSAGSARTTISTTSTARSPPTVRSQNPPLTPTDASGPTRSGAATPGPSRRPALRVPGQFSDRYSETDTDAPPMSREPSVTSPGEGSITSRSSSERTPSVTFSDPLVSQTRPTLPFSRRYQTGTPIGYTSPPPVVLPLRSILSPPMVPRPHPATPPPERPRTPSELEYVTITAIPDNIQQLNPVRAVLSDDERSIGSSLRGKSDRSGLTTPTSDTSRPNINVYSPEPVKSGLTTPRTLPPVRVLDEAARTASVVTGDFSDATPIPIPIRLYDRGAEDDAEQVKASLLHPELLPDINTPQPSPGLVQPAQYLPSPVDEKAPIRMPEPQLHSDVGASRLSTSEPPPAYEHTPGEHDDDTPGGSVISNLGDRQRLLQRAESLRSIADQSEKRRTQLRKELEAARRNREWWNAFRLKHEMDMAEKETREMHAKAARRFYRAHNLRPEPQTIDVHRLKVVEALEKVDQALYDAIVTNTPELRIITGRGNHSKNGIPALKLAIIGAMQDDHIDVTTDANNPGVLIIHPPANPNLPSTSS
ncbi:hypothetical protein C8Q74DRAFT_1258812 [Fomes fomentarius]|nr:hypothetical protein C8Q74DRAFT_1258812 [Fomes fomentarius]